MKKLELDNEYLLPDVQPEDISKMFNQIMEKLCNAEKLGADEYLGMLVDYLTYINCRDEIGKIKVKVSSRLKGTTIIMSIHPPKGDREGLIEINPENKAFFKFMNYYNLFDMINALEHEISHAFEYLYLPSSYLKFVQEDGKDAYMSSGEPAFFKDLFLGHEFEYAASRWAKAQYFSMHSEQFARRRALKNTKNMFVKMIEYAKSANMPPRKISEIVHGYVRHEREMRKDEERKMSFAKKFFAGKEFVEGKSILDVKKAWDKFIDKLVQDDLLSLDHMNKKKAGVVNRNLGYVLDLCNLHILYNQENFEKLFAWQFNKEKLNLNNLMDIICQRRNSSSRKQLEMILQKLKGSEEEQKFYKACEKLFAKPKEKPLVNPNILEK